MKLTTRILLVALRLVIGWHFLVEGFYKFETPWSSESYLHETTGPLAPVFHDIADDAVAHKLTLLPPPSASAEDQESVDRFPPLLAREWDEYRDHFIRYYEADQEARQAIDDAFRQSKADFVHWAVTGKGGVVSTAPFTGAKAEYKLPLAERLQEYGDKRREITRLQAETMHPSQQAGSATHRYAEEALANAKKDLIAIRTSLREDLHRQTQLMESALLKALEREQGASSKLSMPEPSRFLWRDGTPRQRTLGIANWVLIVLMLGVAIAFLHAIGVNVKSWPGKRWVLWLAWLLLVSGLLVVFLLPWLKFNRLEWVDGLVIWGLVTVGACLLAGFCTRIAAVVGALIVLSFWLSMPPLPWLPAPPTAEGHYLWINKNIIEGVALLILATTAVGQWAGLDGILRLVASHTTRSVQASEPGSDEVMEVAPAKKGPDNVPVPAARVEAEGPR